MRDTCISGEVQEESILAKSTVFCVVIESASIAVRVLTSGASIRIHMSASRAFEAALPRWTKTLERVGTVSVRKTAVVIVAGQAFVHASYTIIQYNFLLLH